MTRFREALDDYADQAPPIDLLADRVLARSQRSRRRRRLGVPLAAAGLVAATIAGLVFTGLLPTHLFSTDIGPANTALRDDGPRTIVFPETADPLPRKNVEPALLGYNPGCREDKKGTIASCSPWRIVTRDGRHWTVADALWQEGQQSDHADLGGLSVSPDGSRIAYFRKNGSFVIRDLAGGAVKTAFSWDRTLLMRGNAEILWSPDGRWLGVVAPTTYLATTTQNDEATLAVSVPKVRLVDTTALETVDLDAACCLSGMPGSTGPIAYTPVKGKQTILVDHTGVVVQTMPNRLAAERRRDGFQGWISPDGKTFAAIGIPKGLAGEVSLVDVSDGRVLERHPIRGEQQKWGLPVLLGWSSSSSVLIQTKDWKGHATTLNDPGKGNVDRMDLRTGRMERVLQFPFAPTGLSVAYRTLS